MRLRSLVPAAFVAVSFAAIGFAADAPRVAHPHFNDGGTLTWAKKLADAQALAKASDKLIFIEYGRAACGNCKAVCETVLPDPKVKDRMSKLAVGLAAECDPPNREEAVGKVLSAKLAGASTLPFVGFVTHDLQWVAGFAGYKDVAGFEAVLAEAEKSPLLNASPENTKKLEALAVQAEQGVEKSAWLKVFAAAKSAGDVSGRAPARDRIDAAVAKARAFADTEMTKTLDAVASGGDRAAARAALKKVQSAFAGEPEAKEAEAGVKAIDRLGVIDGVAAEKQAAAKEKAAKDFSATRWATLFGASGEPKGDDPAPAEEPAK